MEVKFYKVGGCVRDQFLGLKSKDIDYTVVAPSYDAMKAEILRRGGEIFLEKPEFLTIRAKVPVLGATDFVLARKDGYYSDGRRPDNVQVGTLFDDLSRRDFTMNAIAVAEDGGIIDPFNGQEDIARRLIRCVGNPFMRFNEDALRLLRAIRFGITKKFRFDANITECLKNPELLFRLTTVSTERVREELTRCFRADTVATLTQLAYFQGLRDAIFSRKELWLKPTTELP